MTSPSVPRDGDDERDLDEVARRHLPRPQRVAFSSEGMVSTAHYLATEAGRRILAAGGNAVDAAVASAFALGVCEPQASGLGGQTLMTISLASPRRRTFALDGSSRAPLRATREVFEEASRLHGYTATTVPTTPAALGYALERYGTLSISAVLQPAIEFAEEGFRVSPLLHSLMVREKKHLRRHSGGVFFLKDGRRPYPVGSLLRQPVLAATLRRIALEGVEDFYTGWIAERIVEDHIRNGGLIRQDDLARPPFPIERRPVSCKFDRIRLRTFPPPGAGRVLVEMIHVAEEIGLDRLDPDDPDGALLLAEIMRQAAQDRLDRPYDPEFYAQVTDREMTDRAYARTVARRIRRRIRHRLRSQGETTHLSVMDSKGNAVALTQSIERVFGSCCATLELGFLYNNYMSAYELDDPAHPYYLRPAGVPWGSVAPSVGFRGDTPWLVIGSPGSERIVTAIFQVLLRMRRQSPFDAVDAPRMHCSYDGKVSLEASRFRDDIPRVLREHGFEIDEREPYSFYMGCVQLVRRERHGFLGVADPRRDGSAGGPER